MTANMDKRLLELLACPLCKGRLSWDKAKDELICDACRVAYPITQGIPVLLPEEATPLPPALPQPPKEG